MSVPTLEAAFDEVRGESHDEDELIERWREPILRCYSAQVLMALGAVGGLENLPLVLAVAFESGRRFGRSELIAELEPNV